MLLVMCCRFCHEMCRRKSAANPACGGCSCKLSNALPSPDSPPKGVVDGHHWLGFSTFPKPIVLKQVDVLWLLWCSDTYQLAEQTWSWNHSTKWKLRPIASSCSPDQPVEFSGATCWEGEPWDKIDSISWDHEWLQYITVADWWS